MANITPVSPGEQWLRQTLNLDVQKAHVSTHADTDHVIVALRFGGFHCNVVFSVLELNAYSHEDPTGIYMPAAVQAIKTVLTDFEEGKRKWFFYGLTRERLALELAHLIFSCSPPMPEHKKKNVKRLIVLPPLYEDIVVGRISIQRYIAKED